LSLRIVFRPIMVWTGSEDREGRLAIADDALAAVLVRLSPEIHGADLSGRWFVEAGFGSCATDLNKVTFDTLEGAHDWVQERLQKAS
jgi:hypothetical protein